jgi:hypothetical protein
MSNVLPDRIVQEIRSLVAVQCRDLVMQDKGKGEESRSQKIIMQKVFHGSGGYSSILDALLAGKGAHAHMYITSELENNREGNEQRRNGLTLELKEVFHCDTGCRFIVHESGFTRDVLAYKNKQAGGELLQGRTIDSLARVVIAMI